MLCCFAIARRMMPIGWLLIRSMIICRRLLLSTFTQLCPPIFRITLSGRVVKVLLELTKLVHYFFIFENWQFRFLFLSLFEEFHFITKIFDKLGHLIEILDDVLTCLVSEQPLQILLVHAIVLAHFSRKAYLILDPLVNILMVLILMLCIFYYTLKLAKLLLQVFC